MIKAIGKVDPRKRPCTSQGSCLHINSPWFTSTGTIDFEDMVNIGFADSPMFGYDAYSTEDGFIGCDLEYLLSLTGTRDMLNGEGNTHGQDPRIAAPQLLVHGRQGRQGHRHLAAPGSPRQRRVLDVGHAQGRT